MNIETKINKKRGKQHKLSKTSIYKVWKNLIGRCYYPSNSNYPYYGALGIKICDQWHKFENFYKDMGERPLGLSLIRLNKEKDYSPNNCKWGLLDIKNEVDQRFGKWIILEKLKYKTGIYKYKCRCECGKEFLHLPKDIRRFGSNAGCIDCYQRSRKK